LHDLDSVAVHSLLRALEIQQVEKFVALPPIEVAVDHHE
jgi:hypothetical protein